MQSSLRNIARCALRFQKISRTLTPVVGCNIRQLSTPARNKNTQTVPETTAEVLKIAVINDEVASSLVEKPKSVGSFYHNLQYLSRKENSMGSDSKPVKYLTSANLMTLFTLVKSPEDGKYVVKLTNYYQGKGLDFSEALAIKFIEASIIGNQAKTAAEHCAIYKNRMGAWLSSQSLNELVKVLCSTNEIEVAVKMLETISVKGVTAQPSTFDLLFTKALEDGEKSYDFHKTLILAAQKMIPADDWKALTEKFPAPPEPTVASSEPEVTAENP